MVLLPHAHHSMCHRLFKEDSPTVGVFALLPSLAAVLCCCRCNVYSLSLAACVVMQTAMEALVSDWIGVLACLPRLWEEGGVTRLITSPGEEHPPHPPLAALIDAGNFRALVAQLQQSWQAAFAQAETFRQVSKRWGHYTCHLTPSPSPHPHPPLLQLQSKESLFFHIVSQMQVRAEGGHPMPPKLCTTKE